MTAFIVILLIVLFGAGLLIVLSGIALYARLVRLRSTVYAARSEMDNALGNQAGPTKGAEAELKENASPFVLDYNEAVKAYNSAIDTFPAQIVAKLFALEKARSFDG